MIQLGKTDLFVSELCFGTCPVGLTHTEQDFFRLMDEFCENGGNFFDTANVYGRWAPWFDNLCEKRMGVWLRQRGDHPIVATKGGHYDLSAAHPVCRVTKEAVRADLEDSLRALGLSTIDFYWLHRDNPALPVGEILEFMEKFKKEGKLRWYGASNFTAARLYEAREYADAHGISGFSAVSDQWSLADVNPGANNNPDPTLALFGKEEWNFHSDTGTPCVPFQSTARGWFAKTAAGQPVEEGVTRAFDNAHNRAVLRDLVQESDRTGHSVQALAISRLAAQPFEVVPVTSASNEAQMKTLLEALALLQKRDGAAV